jgi:hypothetical protein
MDENVGRILWGYTFDLIAHTCRISIPVLRVHNDRTRKMPIMDNDALSRSTKHEFKFDHTRYVCIKITPSSTARFEAPGHSMEQGRLHISKIRYVCLE